MYSSPPTLEALSPFAKGKQKKDAQTALRNSAREVNTSFVLEMTFKADAGKSEFVLFCCVLWCV